MSHLIPLRRALLAASVLVATVAGLPAAHAATATPNATPSDRAQPLTRAEVQADLALWRRAKVDEYNVSETWPTMQAQRAQRMAVYQGWRQGPEFQEELRRQQGAAR
jgi:hypothetical protein